MKIKRYTLFIIMLCLILVLLAAWAVRTAGAKAVPAKSSCSWQVVPAPTAGQAHLYSLAALSSSDIWSAGEYLSIGGVLLICPRTTDQARQRGMRRHIPSLSCLISCHPTILA